MRQPRLAVTLIVICLVTGVASAAGLDFNVRFDDTRYITLYRGTADGLHHATRDAPDAATAGELVDRHGEVIGTFTVVYADEYDATARVDRLDPRVTLDFVDSVVIPDLGLEYLKFRPADSRRFFRLDVGWETASAHGLKHGSKGRLYAADGRVAGLFSVLAVGPRESVGTVTEFSHGEFARDIVRGEVEGYLAQVVSSTGFANLSWLNVVMLIVGGFFIYLGVAKDYEPLLLVPIGFGILVGNIPLPLQIFNAVSVYMIDPVTHEYVFNTTTNSVMGMIYFGVRSGLFPPLIFLGIGALTDFSALLSNPKSVLLGAAAQVGIFVTFLGALKLGFSPANAAAIGIIGGADGPTAIFLSSRLAPSLIGPIAIAAYSYMAMVPIIQPPIMKLLTTKAERKIRMKPGRKVGKVEKVLFPIVGMVVTTLVAPGGLPLLGMLFFGNLLKESGVTSRLAKTASSAVLDTATILLGLAVGASTSAQVFLTRQSILIFVLGCLAFATATAGGVLFAKTMNLFSLDKVNPLIGAAGVSAVPDSARVVHTVGQEADPTNYLLQHAMGPNVAGVIGSAIAAGVFLGIF
jgi:carboxybiotin decarboxylase